MGGGNRHAVAWLMASAAGATVASQTLKKWPCQVNASAGCAVSLGSAAWVREKHSVGDQGKSVTFSADSCPQRSDKYEKGGETDTSKINAKPRGRGILHGNTPWRRYCRKFCSAVQGDGTVVSAKL